MYHQLAQLESLVEVSQSHFHGNFRYHSVMDQSQLSHFSHLWCAVAHHLVDATMVVCTSPWSEPLECIYSTFTSGTTLRMQCSKETNMYKMAKNSCMQVEKGTICCFYEFNLNNQKTCYNSCEPRITNVWYIRDLQTKIFLCVAGVIDDPGQGPDLKWWVVRVLGRMDNGQWMMMGDNRDDDEHEEYDDEWWWVTIEMMMNMKNTMMNDGGWQ